MRFVLLLITLVMFFITSRYNNLDWYENTLVDLLVQFLHIATLFIIFYKLVQNNYVLISLFCAYVIIKNIKCFFYGTDEDDDDYDENNTDDDNNKER